MHIDKTVGMDYIEGYGKVYRESARSIAIKDGKVLMVAVNRGSVTFPGGGIEPSESIEETLIRETKEEAGYQVIGGIKRFATVLERKMDKFEPEKVFEMISHYYLCQVDDKPCGQTLEYYEAMLEMKPVWLTPQEAIAINKDHRSKLDQADVWTLRTQYILERLIDEVMGE